jgi:alginate O-acetyltransferase complex protein AlgJ
MLEKMGIPYFHMVPPNAHSVYPEDLPDHVHTNHTRPIFQLVEELDANKSFATLIYPLEEIVAGKPRLLYPKTDPHWSAIGAFLAYQRLADEMSPAVRMHRVAEADVAFRERMLVGELGFKVEPQQEAPDIEAQVLSPTAYLVWDNCVRNTGSTIITECAEAPPTTCLVLGDSFADGLRPYLAASFGRFVNAQTPRLDYGFVREHEPDVVISVLNERFMIVVPDDLNGPTVRDLEQEKKAHGILRRPMRVFPRRSAD